jgi:hypothetical protein
MSHQTLMMGTDMVPEILVIFNQLIQLIAPEDFINFNCHESFTSYINKKTTQQHINFTDLSTRYG